MNVAYETDYETPELVLGCDLLQIVLSTNNSNDVSGYMMYKFLCVYPCRLATTVSLRAKLNSVQIAKNKPYFILRNIYIYFITFLQIRLLHERNDTENEL